MANRAGSKVTLRAAATYAANDTWYAVDTPIRAGANANSLLLYVTSAVASPGNVDFYIQHTDGDPTTGTYFTLGTGGETPELFGPIAFGGAETRSIVIPGLLPLEYIKLYFRCSSGATSATLGITGLSYLDESGISNTDVAIGDIEVANPLVQVSKTAATGTAAIAASTGAFTQAFELDNITLHLSAAGTTSENFTVTLNAFDGAAYDTVLVSEDLSTDSVIDLVLTPEEDGIPTLYAIGDAIDVAWPNTETRTYGLRIVGRLV
jgi:hypothetical protein